MTASANRTPASTDADLRASFAENGFLVLHGILPVDDVEACATALAGLRQAYPDLNVALDAPARDRFDAMDRLTRRAYENEAIENIALHAGIQNVLRQIFGQEPVARYTRLLAESPGSLAVNAARRGTPHLHNFGQATRPPGGRVIVWTPVDHVHPDAGPMWFLPKSHLEFASFPDRLIDAVPGAREQLHRMWADGASAETWLAWHGELGDHSMEILADWMDQHAAWPVPVILRRGDVLIFSNDLLHGTLPAKNPQLSRRIMFTHYHADGRELWEIGDALGSDENQDGPRLYQQTDWVRRDGGLIDPDGFRRFYASMKGFFS